MHGWAGGCEVVDNCCVDCRRGLASCGYAGPLEACACLFWRLKGACGSTSLASCADPASGGWHLPLHLRARPDIHGPLTPIRSAKESIGGGDKSNHGRRKQLMGHVRFAGTAGAARWLNQGRHAAGRQQRGCLVCLITCCSSRSLRHPPLDPPCRSLLLRSQASTAEVRALHGLCKELERRQQNKA